MCVWWCMVISVDVEEQQIDVDAEQQMDVDEPADDEGHGEASGDDGARSGSAGALDVPDTLTTDALIERLELLQAESVLAMERETNERLKREWLESELLQVC